MQRLIILGILAIITVGGILYFTVPNIQDLLSSETTVQSEPTLNLMHGRPKGEVLRAEQPRKRRHHRGIRAIYREKSESTFDTFKKWAELIMQLLGSLVPLLTGGALWKKLQGASNEK